MGLPFGHHNHIANIQRSQHDAGEKSARVQLDHRHACGGAIDNQQYRGGNQNAQAAACGDGASGQLHAVARAQHSRQGQQAHQRDHRAHNARSRGKNGAGDDRRHSQCARHPCQGQVQALEQLVNQVGPLNQVAHENKQRYCNQHIVGHHRIGALHHQVKNLPHRNIGVDAAVRQPAKKHAHAHQGEGRREAQHDGHHHQAQHDQAQVPVCHMSPGDDQKQGDDDQRHQGKTKPEFFANRHLLAPCPVKIAPSCSVSSTLTWTMALSFSTSTSSTSCSREGHSPS